MLAFTAIQGLVTRKRHSYQFSIFEPQSHGAPALFRSSSGLAHCMTDDRTGDFNLMLVEGARVSLSLSAGFRCPSSFWDDSSFGVNSSEYIEVFMQGARALLRCKHDSPL